MRIELPLVALLLGAGLLAAGLLGGGPAMAQDSPEDRLRDMLRRTTVELRAAQDSQAVLQASLDQEKQKTATLQKQLDDLASRPAQAAKPAVSDEEIAQLRADAQSKVAQVEAGLKQWQDAYQKAADIARAKDQDSKIATARATESARQAGVCEAANIKLEAVANDILHLYQTQSFRSLLLASYEPLLGLKKVELENTIQNYEDKILDQKYYPGAPK
jgi:type IV secretory pathway TrbL component